MYSCVGEISNGGKLATVTKLVHGFYDFPIILGRSTFRQGMKTSWRIKVTAQLGRIFLGIVKTPLRTKANGSDVSNCHWIGFVIDSGMITYSPLPWPTFPPEEFDPSRRSCLLSDIHISISVCSDPLFMLEASFICEKNGAILWTCCQLFGTKTPIDDYIPFASVDSKNAENGLPFSFELI